MSFISEYISGAFGNNPGINENAQILEQKFAEGSITKFDEVAGNIGLLLASIPLTLIHSAANGSFVNTIMNLVQVPTKDLGPITVENAVSGKEHVVGVEMDRGYNRLSGQDNKLILHIDTDGDGKADRDQTVDTTFVRKGEHGRSYLETKYDVNGDGKLDTIVVDRKGGKWREPEIFYGK